MRSTFQDSNTMPLQPQHIQQLTFAIASPPHPASACATDSATALPPPLACAWEIAFAIAEPEQSWGAGKGCSAEIGYGEE